MHEDRGTRPSIIGRLERVRRELISPHRYCGPVAVHDRDVVGARRRRRPRRRAGRRRRWRWPPTYEPAGPGTAWGRPWAHGVVPARRARCPTSGPAGRSRRSSTWVRTIGARASWPRAWSGRQGRDGTWAPERGLHPANHSWRVARRGRRGGERVDLLRRGGGQPADRSPATRPQQRPADRAGRGPSTAIGVGRPGRAATSRSPASTTTCAPSWVVRSAARCPTSTRARESSPRSTGPSTRSTSTTSSARPPRPAPRSTRCWRRPAERVGPPHLGRRPRPHRLGLAVADPRDQAEVRPHVLQRAAPDGARSRGQVRVLAGRAVRVDARALPGDLRADHRPGWPRAGGSPSAASGSRPTAT